MKKLFYFLICIPIIYVGCNDSDDDNNNPPTGTVTDIEGNVYHTVTIGTQVWTVENLKTTKLRNGDAIPDVTDATEWQNMTTAALCAYENDNNNALIYGYLYNWYAVTDSRGLAPAGWHIASDEEWTTLASYLGGESTAGAKLKEAGTSHWMSPNAGANNETGFTALPGGVRVFGGSFYELTTSGFYWSITESSATEAWERSFNFSNTLMEKGMNNKAVGYSVRCVKD